MKKFDQINVVPFIDVMLVLLAVVMVTASFITLDKLNLELPQTQQAAQAAPDEKALHLALDATGKLYLDEQPITLAVLSARLQTAPKTVTLKVDRRCAFEHFVSVIERIKAAHPAPKLNILTEHVQP